MPDCQVSRLDECTKSGLQEKMIKAIDGRQRDNVEQATQHKIYFKIVDQPKAIFAIDRKKRNEETGLKRLFRHVGKCLTHHPQPARSSNRALANILLGDRPFRCPNIDNVRWSVLLRLRWLG